jgi:hypothetical protein
VVLHFWHGDGFRILFGSVAVVISNLDFVFMEKEKEGQQRDFIFRREPAPLQDPAIACLPIRDRGTSSSGKLKVLRANSRVPQS